MTADLRSTRPRTSLRIGTWSLECFSAPSTHTLMLPGSPILHARRHAFTTLNPRHVRAHRFSIRTLARITSATSSVRGHLAMSSVTETHCGVIAFCKSPGQSPFLNDLNEYGLQNQDSGGWVAMPRGLPDTREGALPRRRPRYGPGRALYRVEVVMSSGLATSF